MFTMFLHKTKMSRAGIHMYMYIAAKKYVLAALPHTGVPSFYDLISTPGNETMSACDDVILPSADETFPFDYC